MWKLLLQEIFGVEFTPSSPLVAHVEDCTEHYQNTLKDCAFDRILVGASYEWAVDRSIHRFKYENLRDEVRVLTPLLVAPLELLRMSLGWRDQLVFTSVPVSAVRYFSRGFNQSALLAKTLVKSQWGIYRTSLIRKPSIRHQAHLVAAERLKNVRSAFLPFPFARKYLQGKHIVLIDDVISTGSTANECAKVLKQMWAKKVSGLFLARSQV